LAGISGTPHQSLIERQDKAVEVKAVKVEVKWTSTHSKQVSLHIK